MTGKKINLKGHKAFVFDQDMMIDLEKLLAMQATDQEVAVWFGIDRSTLFACKERDPEFAESYQNGKDKGKASLRRLMWQSAQGTLPVQMKEDGKPVWDPKNRAVLIGGQAPSVSMQIFLAKNILGMSDRQEITGKDGAEIVVRIVTDD